MTSKLGLGFRKAAEKDYVLAQHNLGRMYSKGLGVEKDLAKAWAWFQKAANQGFREAKIALEEMKPP